MDNRSRTSRRLEFKRIGMSVALALPVLAQAQQVPDGAAELAEVKVSAQTLGATTEGTHAYASGKSATATPLSLSLRDTPQSVSVVTQQRIADQGLNSVTDVVQNVTGVSAKRYESNRAEFSARGFDIDNLQIDGVPTAWDQSWSAGEVLTNTAIYDRVEVVRGATGLMTGTGNPSAAINLVRKRADSKDVTGSVELGVGRWDQRRAQADIATPLNASGSVRARAVGAYEEGDSWVTRLHNQTQTLFATVEADLSASTLVWAGISHQDNDPTGSTWGSLPAWYSDGSRTHWARSATTAANWTRWHSVDKHYFAGLEQRFDNGWKLRASYDQGLKDGDSYLLYLWGNPSAQTGLGLSGGAGSYNTHSRQDDFGLQASGPFRLLGRTHELAMGYIHSKRDFTAGTRGYLNVDVGDFNNWRGEVTEPTWNPLSLYETSTITQDAAYGVARLSLADPLKLILGTRVTHYQKSGYGIYAPAYSFEVDHRVTPYAGLIYDLDDTYSVYASYTSIFQPQDMKDAQGKYLDPVVGNNAEAGVKAEYLDGRLNGSLAVFHIKQDNLGQSDGVNAATGETYYRAIDGAKSQGFELDVAGELLRDWSVSFGYTRFTATDATGADVNTTHPRRIVRLFSAYRLPGAWQAVTLGGGVNWQGLTYGNAPNPAGVSERIEQKDFSTVNLLARYEFNKQASVQLNINNVFDKEYLYMYPSSDQINYGEPRSAKLSFKYRF